MGVEISKIDTTLAKKFRKELGDLNELYESIKEKGLVHPIVLKPLMESDLENGYATDPDCKYILVSGLRRLEVAKTFFSLVELPDSWVRICDYGDLLGSFRDANEKVKPLTVKERTLLAMAIEEELKKKRAEKLKIKKAAESKTKQSSSKTETTSNKPNIDIDMHEGRSNELPKETEIPLKTKDEQSKLTGKKEQVENEGLEDIEEDPELVEEPRWVAAKKAGLGRVSYWKSKKIIEAAQKDIDRFGDLVDKLDIEPVSKVYDEYQKRKKEEQYGPCETLMRLAASDKKVPEFVWKALVCLPHKKQEEILKEYGDYIFLIKRSDYDRAVKNYSKGKGFEVLSQQKISEVLRDVLEWTKEETEKWVFMDAISSVANIVVMAMGLKEGVEVIDKVEFCFLGMAVFIQALCSIKGIDTILDQDQATKEELKNFSQILSIVEEMYKKGIFRRIALKVKEIHGSLEEIINEKGVERGAINAINAYERIDEKMPEIKHMQRILEKLKQL